METMDARSAIPGGSIAVAFLREAVERNAPLEDFEAILEKKPRIDSQDLFEIIACALREQCDANVLQGLILHDPSCSQITRSGDDSSIYCNLLQYAIAWSAPLQVVELLLELHSEAVLDVNRWEENAIDLAVTDGAHEDDVERVKVLLQHYHKPLQSGSPLYWAVIIVHTPFQIIDLLLNHSPNLVSIWHEEDWGEGESLPIHCVCWNHPDSVRIAERLIALYRQGIRTPDASGNLPLHNAISQGAPFEAVQLLVEAYPNGLRTRTSDDEDSANLPLHLACSCSQYYRNVQVIRFLIDKYPKGLRGANGHGMLPLHLTCDKRDPTAEIVDLLLSRYPDALSASDNSGSLPLHVACKNTRLPIEVLRLLTSRYPEATSVPDNDGNLPLHHVCRTHRCDVDIPCLLLEVEHRTTGLSVANGQGMLPLHIACGRGYHHFETFRLLISRYPEAVSIQDNDGNLPIHHLCKKLYRDSLEVLHAMLEVDRSILSVSNGQGMLPLHLACTKYALPFEVFRRLKATYPEAVAIPDNDGCLPLHHACQNNLHTEVIRVLLEMDLSSVLRKTSDGRTLMQLAEECRTRFSCHLAPRWRDNLQLLQRRQKVAVLAEETGELDELVLDHIWKFIAPNHSIDTASSTRKRTTFAFL